MVPNSTAGTFQITITEPGINDEPPDATFISIKGDMKVVRRVVRNEAREVARSVGLDQPGVPDTEQLDAIVDNLEPGGRFAIGGWIVTLEIVADSSAT